MTVEQFIHEWWRDEASLHATLSADKLFTGIIAKQDEDLPYCTLNRENNRAIARTSSARIDQATMRFQAYSEDLEFLRAVVEMMKSSFDNKSRAGGEISIRSMRYDQDSAIQDEEDGLWMAIIDFEAMYQTNERW